MKLADVAPETLRRISKYRYDQIIEKHEGPWSWDYLLEDRLVEFLNVDGYDVLLPIDKEHHANVTFLRCIASENNQSLTVFLTDTTYESGIFAGRVAVCDKVPGEGWYMAHLYHAWMVINNEEGDPDKGGV